MKAPTQLTLIVTCALVALACVWSCASSVSDAVGERRAIPSDYWLSQHFTQGHDSFNRLVTMVQEDSEVVRVASDFTWARGPIGDAIRPGTEVGFTLQRWNEYRRLFKELGIEGGIAWRPEDKPRVIYFVMRSRGSVLSGTSKGYAFSQSPPTPLCESLDALATDTSSGTCFKPIAGKWYLYFERD